MLELLTCEFRVQATDDCLLASRSISSIAFLAMRATDSKLFSCAKLLQKWWIGNEKSAMHDGIKN